MYRLLLVTALSWAVLCQARQSAESAPQSESPHFESKLNVVLVPVLVRDAGGQAVGDLKQQDFQVFDNDKLQALTGFTIQKRAVAASRARESQQTSPLTQAQTDSSTGAVPDRFIVFLFDDLHLSSSDLSQTQEAGAKMLAESLGNNDAAAVFSISGITNSGITRDRAKLASAMASVRSQSIYRPIGRQCPDLSYYQSEIILNKHDDQALQAAVQETVVCSGLQKKAAEQRVQATASQTLSLGEQSTHVTLEMIKFIVKRMAALPGPRNLILISPGFLTMEALDEKSEIIDLAAQANVTVSALDARGLYVNEPPASDPLSASPDLLRMKTSSRRSSMSADEDVMAELAYGTGGVYFHNSNDLSDGFAKLTLAPEYLYLLEFSPTDARQDGSYHRLKVKVTQDGLKLQARRGYYAPKPSKKK